MTAKFQQSWLLFKASLSVTLRHRKLLWFPVLSTFLTGFIALFFLTPLALPVVLHPTGYHLNQKQHWVALKNYYLPENAIKPKPGQPAQPASPFDLLSRLAGRPANAASSGQPGGRQISPVVSAYLVLIYFVSMFLATFFNVAFYSEIIAALNGQGVSFRRGLKLACSRWTSILAWTLLAGVVGWIIHKIQERLPMVGRIVTGVIGLAWSVAAVFVIPVIIQEQPMLNPLKILRQSALTLKRTWGEGLIGAKGEIEWMQNGRLRTGSSSSGFSLEDSLKNLLPSSPLILLPYPSGASLIGA
jgi:uncharacterized membrane protein YeaQ/YmgE (transglycosylase-associated protein family)